MSESQSEFRMKRTWRPVLVDVNRAMEATGYGMETVIEMVDAGELLWVWDVGLMRQPICAGRVAPVRRELRFWLGELLAPEAQRGRTLDEVIEMVLGKRASSELRRVTVKDVLLLRPQQVMRLVMAGELSPRVDGHPCWVTRASVEGFLRRRWVGNAGQQQEEK